AIKKALDVTSTGVLPQIKLLKDNGILVQKDDEYELSIFGNIVVQKILPIFKLANTLEKNPEYWFSRDISALPMQFMERLGDLGDSKVIEPDINSLFDPPQELIDHLLASRHVTAITSYFHPYYVKHFIGLAKKGVDINLIFTKAVYKRIVEDHGEEAKVFFGMDDVNIYIHKGDLPVVSMVCADSFFLLSLLNKKGIYDHNKLISTNEEAVIWGHDLFEYYYLESQKKK
ncbi:MAG: helix-turn-helix transcriptional regulator, partial [Methanohalophilus sp.]